ncbi:MAG: helix-turn-helix transcriptional regulator [Nitriliruptoraceae bacterium]|nr:helix-turn-helix transcriptional regulator [Nitriliruptoraceae bacterium]
MGEAEKARPARGGASGPASAGSDAAAVDDGGTVPQDQATEDAQVDPSALDELGGYIRHQRESAALSLRKLAKIAGVSNPYLSQIERGLRKPSAEILQAIAKALEISSETLYVKAGILEERPEDVDVEGAVRRDPDLSDAQREALLEMYRSFKRVGAARPARGSRRRALLDAVTPGGLDDQAIRAASSREESDDA